ncbi:unnamed protein product [Tilletia controversa]|uniref:VASt domain-containing protein n=2 Tax=Tilletia TaxID=13289 RepID=A0A8X7MS05_9BASI|nr:hypothetical protein CF336_g5062 [Tilletia laevis]KAE8194388.1 hypothetical protein CF328_g4761 [Tilletia controversa]CAD6893106.1 unnamed protein product [Tilletia caries]KAE8198287.1 hypothetical protein CF335_g4418 [Tilletia laevis]KAE8245749.1 hypothetical protein A4X06_0g5446 [Tilletia controversa]
MVTSSSDAPDYSNSSGLAPPGVSTTSTSRRPSSASSHRAFASEAASTPASPIRAPAKRPGMTKQDNNSLAAGLTAAFETALGSTGASFDYAQQLGARTPGTPLPQPVLTPSGIGAIGGLSPSGMGEGLTLDDNEIFPSRWHEGDGMAAPVSPSSNRTANRHDHQYSTVGETPLVTGFAVASTKRNNAFHQMFPNVPEDDFLIEDYACALARDILVQGRVYVSENHLAFNANIFGWVTNVVIPFTDIVSIEKRMTAFVIPNAIQISTLHAKHTFTSFLSRDTAYDLIADIWRLFHPNFRSNFDAMPDFSDDDSVHESEKGDSLADESQDQAGKNTKKLRLKDKLKRAGKSGGDTSRSQTGDDNVAEKDGDGPTSAAGTGSGSGPSGGNGSQSAKKAAHRPTTCSCEKNKEHYPTVVLDNKYPAVPEKMYNLLFSSGFMKDFWNNNQKLMDLQMSDWCPDASSQKTLSRSMSYIKPLTGSFGPKQAKCIITDQTMHVDFDDYVTTLTTTRTPDVPNGGIFATKTRTCFSWAGGNTTKIFVSCTVEWSGRSMIKGIIDKASIDGQRQYYKELNDAIHVYLKEHASEFKEEGDEAVVEDGTGADAGSPVDGAQGDSGEKEGNSGADSKTGDAGGSGGAGGSSGEGGASAAGGMFSTYLDMVTGAVSDGLGMLMDAVSGASPSMLILGTVVVVLLLSNMWALTIREPPAGYRKDGMGYSREGAGWRDVREGGYGHVAGGGRGGGGGAGDASSDALAAAMREVLREHFGNGPATPDAGLVDQKRQHQQQERGGSGGGKGKAKAKGSVGDQVDEIKNLMAMINDAESKIAKLKDDIRG